MITSFSTRQSSLKNQCSNRFRVVPSILTPHLEVLGQEIASNEPFGAMLPLLFLHFVSRSCYFITCGCFLVNVSKKSVCIKILANKAKERWAAGVSGWESSQASVGGDEGGQTRVRSRHPRKATTMLTSLLSTCILGGERGWSRIQPECSHRSIIVRKNCSLVGETIATDGNAIEARAM